MVTRILPKTMLFLSLIMAAIAILWLPTHADEPTAVHLADFDVVPLDSAVRVDWETGSESGTLGFMIKRATGSGSEEYLDYIGDNGFIGGEGGVAVGSNYSVTDNQVQNGTVYTYILIEVENSGTETELARETVTAGVPPTNTPIAISGGGGSTAATATATLRATAQATATATTQSQSATATALPTNTPPSFVTVTPRAGQPTATATQTSSSTGNQSNGNSTAIPTATVSVTEETETINSSSPGVSEVLALEEDPLEEAPQEIAAQTEPESDALAQDAYPANSPTETAVTDTNATNQNNTAIGEVTNTPVPVIGGSQGYESEQISDSEASKTAQTASSNQGRAFLWMGFIVALLIFVTGLIGSILLFIRKSK